MTQDDCKLITEKLLGEKWHYLENDAEITCACGEKWVVKSIDVEQHENRSFKDPQDFMDCFDKLVELGKFNGFEAWCFMQWDSQWPFNDLSHHPAEFTQWLLSRTESGHYRLCVLCAEWLKEK
jgi:hypothetical protein